MVTIHSQPQNHCQPSLVSGMSVWVYILGEKNGEDVKVGHTKEPTLRKRIRSINRSEQTTSDEYVLLAAVNATTKDEEYIKEHFAAHLRPKGFRTEYFYPADPVIQYVNWLRSQWYSSINEDDDRADADMVDPEHWLPDRNGRAIAPPVRDDLRIVQDYEDPSDVLYNTAWSWMASQKSGVQDYFTPPEIVDAAREAMGDIDLDAASHPLANRTHKIPDYFHTGRSAFHNDWYGRVWLNPPYGNNAPWFERILHFVEAGAVEQLCMLSPMWAFQTKIARPVIERASGLILLSPTPKFWGNKDPDKTGSNNPHGVIYIGPHGSRFHQAFARFGFPMRPAWSDVEFIPEEEVA
jgi:hypothetical protein